MTITKEDLRARLRPGELARLAISPSPIARLGAAVMVGMLLDEHSAESAQSSTTRTSGEIEARATGEIVRLSAAEAQELRRAHPSRFRDDDADFSEGAWQWERQTFGEDAARAQEREQTRRALVSAVGGEEAAWQEWEKATFGE